jgi:hypothetical protein
VPAKNPHVPPAALKENYTADIEEPAAITVKKIVSKKNK